MSARPAERRLRVGFDGRALTSPAAGVRRYATELFTAIAEHPGIELIALGGDSHAALPAGVSRRAAPLRLPTNAGWTLAGLPLAARGAALDLYHAPAYTAPAFGLHPLVLTIHDVSYARRPEWYPYWRDPVRRAFYRASARAADLVLTESEFSRSEISAAYDIDPARIVVAPLGVARSFRSAMNGPAVPHPTVRLGPYVLHVGDLHPRRDVGTALSAVLRVRRRYPAWATLRLAVVGADLGGLEALVRQAADAGQPEALARLRNVTDVELANLYRFAVALLYPSRYEGFGLPLIEAMACGTPVVAARAASIPEVVGDAGILLDPGDDDAFAEAVAGILSNPEMADRMRTASIERSREFSWSRTAETTIATYERCLALISA